MNSATRILPVSLALTLCTASAAYALPQQTAGGGYVLPFSYAIPDTFGRVVALDFDQSDLSDLALQERAGMTDQLVVMFEPGEWITRRTVTNGVVSFDGLPPFGSFDRAGLVIAKDSGLYLAHWKDQVASLDLREWELIPVPCDPVTECSPCDWCSIDIVRVGDVDGVGGHDIVALDGNTIRVLTQQGSGWDSDPSFPDFQLPAGSIVDLVLYDGRGVGVRNHMAVMYENRLRIYENYQGSWSLVATQSAAAVGCRSISVARIGHAGDKEWVAWLVAENAGVPIDQLHYLCIAGRSFAAPVALVDENQDTVCLRGMAGGDYDGDGYDDLVFHVPLHAKQFLLMNETTGSVPDLDPSRGYTWFDVPDHHQDPVQVVVPYEAQPAFLDLDLDGDMDIAQPVDPSGNFPAKVAAWRNTDVDQDAYKVRPTLQGGTPVDIDVCASGNDTTITLAVTLPDPLPTAATHVRYLFWIKDDENDPVDPNIVSMGDQEIVSGTTDHLLQVDLTGMTPPFDDEVFYWAVRLVEIDESGQDPVLVSQYPVANFIAVFTSDSELWPHDFLDEYLITTPAELGVSECALPAQGGGSGGGNGRTRNRQPAGFGTVWFGGSHSGGGGSTECLPGEDPPPPKPPPGGGG